MKLLFMLCNSCLYLCTESRNWIVDHKNCTCIFLEEASVPVEPIHKNPRVQSALNDGECPCCHGCWGNPDEKACKGCGYELDEDD